MTGASFIAPIERSQIRKRHNRNRDSAHALEIFGIGGQLVCRVGRRRRAGQAGRSAGRLQDRHAIHRDIAAGRLRASLLIPTGKKDQARKIRRKKDPGTERKNAGAKGQPDSAGRKTRPVRDAGRNLSDSFAAKQHGIGTLDSLVVLTNAWSLSCGRKQTWYSLFGW